MTILLCGIRSEPPLALVATALTRLGAPLRWFDQRRARSTRLDLEIDHTTVSGFLREGDEVLPLESVRSVYVRTMDDRLLPEMDTEPHDSPARRNSRALHDRLMTWLEITPALVVNRAHAQISNAAKPYQSQLIAAAGFRVPETLITSDPAEVLEFRARHGRVVYKSMSGVRSIVTLLTDLDLQRLDRIRWCPVQFQAYVDGVDVRVHTIGTEVFAARVTSCATDYRYSDRSGAPPPTVEPFALDPELAQRCLGLARRLGLELAGIDLRITPDGEAVCFEVNPSPAFSYYEQQAGLPIAAAVARHLAAA
jgi:glutathione synthase/RimK-type ligase-like ATP-grasp enzyme